MESEDTSKNTKVSCLSEIETDFGGISKTHISVETKLHFPIYLTMETVNKIQVNSDLDKKPTDDIRSLLGIIKDLSTDAPGIRELRPFMYLNTAKLANARLRRWTLALQPYKYKMERYKVSKGAKIRNRYNQVPYLTQDTNGKGFKKVGSGYLDRSR